MKTILTGASGFLGSYIKQELLKICEVLTIARKGADINVDLALEVPNLSESDLVIHCAGKAHSVPKTEKEKLDFFNVNVMGTKNLLKGLGQSFPLPKSFIFISSVAVYGVESGMALGESTALNAADPYGLSKIQAEAIVQEWCAENNVICSILRLPLLVGDNPPGNLRAMINGIEKGYYFNIAGGKARKSMVMVKDVASIIHKLAEVGGIFNLTDGYHPSFFELSNNIAKQLSKNKIYNIPLWVAKSLAVVGDHIPKCPINSAKLSKITSDLTFDDSKARRELSWNPSKVLDGFTVK